MSFFVFDLDGTLALIDHRRHFLIRTPKDHRGFYDACDADAPNVPVIAALRAHVAAGHRVEIWSGRSDEVRGKTLGWLSRHGIDPKLLTRMRREGDFTKDYVLKKSWLDECGAARPAAIYDDRPSVVEMWRAAGVPCFQVDPGDWDQPEKQLIRPGVAGQALYLMVGPSGAGKSHHVQWRFPSDWVLSSDEIRKRLCGSVQDQSRNDDVFEAIRRIGVARLSSGLSCVIDATHLRRRDRVRHAALAPKGVTCFYIVCDRPLARKVADGGWRNGVVLKTASGDVSLIEKHDQHFRSELANILAGDGIAHVRVSDHRETGDAAA